MERLMPIKYKERSLIEFQMTFMSDEDCAKHLVQQRWGNDFFCSFLRNREFQYTNIPTAERSGAKFVYD